MSDSALEDILQHVVTVHNAQFATDLGNSGDSRAVDALILALQTPPAFLTPHEPIFRFYAVRALGKLRDSRALSLLRSIELEEIKPVIRGKSVSDMAKKAIRLIEAEHQG